jgi:hypothetical protein
MNDGHKNEIKVENSKRKRTFIQLIKISFKRKKRDLKKISKKISSLINPADAIAVASIHATIFSIIIGFISGYALYVYSKVNEIELQVIQEASKINTFQFNKLSSIDRTLDTSNINQRQDVLEQLKMLGMGFPTYNSENLSTKEIIKLPLPTTRADKGLLTLKSLSNLYTHYPFATELLDFSGYATNNPIKFNKVEEVEKWVNDMENTLEPLLWTLTTHRNKHQENFDAVESNFAESVKSVSEELRPVSVKFQVQDYLQIAFSARELIRSVKSQLIQIEARKPNKAIIIGGIIISIIGIIFGVVFPMINKNAPLLCVLWIPIGCYIILFGYILVNLLIQ